MSERTAPFLALDIGTAKTVAVVARRRPEGGVDVLHLVEVPTGMGLRHGMVVNIDATLAVVARVAETLQEKIETNFSEVRATISGAHLACLDNEGIVPVHGAEVSEQDVARVLEAAKQLPLAEDRQLLHALVQEFVLDDLGGIANPVGMSGRKLAVRVHVVTGLKTATHNLVKCIRRAGLNLTTLMVQGLAAAQAVLTEDEKALGVLLLDIGAGTTDMVVYAQGAVRYCTALPLGGDRITHDIAMALRTPAADAERLKCASGAASYDWVAMDEFVDAPTIGDRPPRRLARQRLVDVIHPRVEEIFEMALETLREQGLEEQISAGVVLTGGSAKLSGISDLAEAVFGAPARVGIPYLSNEAEKWEDPAYAAVSGLLHAQWGDAAVWTKRRSGWFAQLLRWFFGTENR